MPCNAASASIAAPRTSIAAGGQGWSPFLLRSSCTGQHPALVHVWKIVEPYISYRVSLPFPETTPGLLGFYTDNLCKQGTLAARRKSAEE
jgi:hypothetical protein